MRTLILGAGALGSLLGARLAQVTDTRLLSRNRDHMQAVQEHGLLLEELDGTVSRHVIPAASDPGEIPDPPDLVLTTVKSYDTRPAVRSVMPACHRGTLFLSLQNGLGNLEQLVEAGLQGKVLAGTTAQGATFLRPGRVRHGGQGPTSIGEPDGPVTDRVQEVAELFRAAGLEAHPSNQARQLIWNKLLINVGINPVTALCRVPNGWIAEAAPATELSAAAVQEAVAVARACGFDPGQAMVEKVVEVARATAGNISSMHQDLRSGKRTEIESINGAVVRLGREFDLPTPVNETLTKLIQLVERRNEEASSHG